MTRKLSEQEIQRRQALEKLRQAGIEPYPAEEFPVTAVSSDILENYDKYQGREVCVAGRIMSRRIMGKASFAVLKDGHGRIQVYFNRDELCPGEDKSLYNEVFKKLLDLGDIIGVCGEVFKTQTGEITVNARRLNVLAKALRPLPVVKVDADGRVHDAFSDPELRYRRRYVDLIVNDHVKETFVKRSKIINAMRRFFDRHGYLEVETPILQPIPGGAAARPFVTHHNALNIPLYLRIANELYLKRLIVGGFDGVYEFAKDFRNEGMDRTHNPEFTVLELYVPYKDYRWMMRFTEELLETVVREVNNGDTKVKAGDRIIDFKTPYPRVPILDAIREHTGYDLYGKSEEEIRQIALDLGLEVDETMGKGKLIDEIFGEFAEKHYVQPTFIIDYPVEMSPLTKKHREKPGLTERFELIVNGKEIANAYSELNDPIDQLERFKEQLRLSEKGDNEAMYIDYDFVRALEYGMPPTAGIGIGIDRLTMLLTGNDSIQEVIFFPQMRPEKKAVELSETEKTVLELLRKQSPQKLDELKAASGLSNKKWDKAVKGLRKKDLIDVRQTGQGLMVEIKN